MVGYGQSLKKCRRPGWEVAYLDYKKLKTIVNELESNIDNRHHNRGVQSIIQAPSDEVTTNTTITTTTTTSNLLYRGENKQQQDNDHEKNEFQTDDDNYHKDEDPEEARLLPSDNNNIRNTSNGGSGGGDKNKAMQVEKHGQQQDQPQRRLRSPSRIDRIKHRFFIELGREIEKMSLFTLQKQGLLADTIGAMRFIDDNSGGGRGDSAQDAVDDGSKQRNNNNNNKKKVASLFKEQATIFQQFGTDDGNNTNETTDELAKYLMLGVELLYLLQFVAVNSIGIRKILKKYNKTVQKLDDPQYYYIMESQNDVHLQQMANSQSMDAIQASLQSSLVQFYYTDQYNLTTNPNRAMEYFRLQSVIQASCAIRKNAQIVNQPFNDFLSRKAMIFTGSNLGGIEGSAMRAMDDLLTFVPSRMLTYNEKRLDAMWCKWVPNYSNQRRMVFDSSGNVQEWTTLVETTRYAMALIEGRQQLQQSHHQQQQQYEDSGPAGNTGSNKIRNKAWGGVDMTSMVLNLISILLYTINYYIVAPTANQYASILGTDGAFGATLIGASSFSALFAAFLYSFWYTKSTFKSALIFSTVCPLIGNMIYAMAISYQSMGMALTGRILCGFGSAEVVNRQLISTCVDFKQMTRASAFFVAFGAMGMSIGPLIAAILDRTAGRDLIVDLQLPFTPAGGIIYNHVTSPGFVMASLWFIELIALVLFFQEPDRINGSGISESDPEDEYDDDRDELTMSFSEEMTALVRREYGSIKKVDSSYHEQHRDDGVASGIAPHPPRLAASISTSWNDRNSSNHNNNEDRQQHGRPSSVLSLSRCCGEVISTWELVTMNPGLPVTLILFCFIELADEILISSCSMVLRRYFGWTGSAAGFLIASLGALVLPANFLVEVYSRRVSEKRIMVFSMWFIILSCIGILNFQGLYYDIDGITEYGDVDPANTTDLKHLELSGVKVGRLFTRENEFPYDWGYGHIVYIVFLSAIFMGTIILEGVDTSIMAQVTPAKLNDRFINSGLLATLVGTLGRVLSDSMITVSALLDVHVFVDFVIATFLPLLLLAVGCLLLVLKFYDKLV